MQNRYASLAGSDSGLTAVGWRQTDLLAQWLATHYRIDALIAAPQLRNRLTAQRVGQAIGLPVAVHPDLAANAEPAFAWDSAASSARGKAGVETDDGGELDVDLCALCLRVAEQYRGRTVAMFLGPEMIAAAMSCLFQADNLHMILEHTSVSELQLYDKHWYMACVNRHEHLPELADPAAPPQRPADLAPAIPEDLSRLSEVYGSDVAAAVEMEDEASRKRIENLISFAEIDPGAQVLDLGTGTGLLALALAEELDAVAVGVDISPAMLERAEFFRLNRMPGVAKRVDFRLAAAQRLPFRNDRFDVVVCRMMLHLNRQPQRIFQEIWRVLKDQGTLVVADLLSADDPVRRATQNAIEERRNPTHVAAHSASQYRELVTGAGFKVEAEETVVFSRSLDDWLSELATNPADGAVVREMIEASLETDAAGINARRHGDELLFDQRLVYIRAVKHTAEE